MIRWLNENSLGNEIRKEFGAISANDALPIPFHNYGDAVLKWDVVGVDLPPFDSTDLLCATGCHLGRINYRPARSVFSLTKFDITIGQISIGPVGWPPSGWRNFRDEGVHGERKGWPRVLRFRAKWRREKKEGRDSARSRRGRHFDAVDCISAIEEFCCKIKSNCNFFNFRNFFKI